MSKRILSLTSLTALVAAGLIVTSTVSAASAAQEQRVMLVQKHRFGAESGKFVLYALTSGQLERDAGSYTYLAAERPPLIRRGQGIAVYITIASFTGKRGTFVLRSRVEFVGAGNGTTVGTGTWSIVSGTKAYAGMKGGGRVAVVAMTPGGDTSSQYEGFVAAPDRRGS